MASSSSVNGVRTPSSFADLDEFLSREIHILKVDNLKQLIQFINSRHGYQIQKTRRKQELVDSVANVFREFRAKGQLDRYQAARAEFSRIAYPTYRGTTMVNGYHGAVPQINGYGSNYSRAGASTSYAPIYPLPNTTYTSAGIHNRAPQTAKWKATPAWKVIKAVSDMNPVPAVDDDAQKRTSKTGNFQIPKDVLDIMKAPPEPGKTQALRLFCTSSEYYPGDGVNVIPMDLPNNYDITLNSHQLKLAKGLKGKAGSTAPVDLMQTTSMGTDALNRAEGLFNMVQFSHTGPTMNKKTKTPKRFYFQVCLTEMTDSTAMRQTIVKRRKTLDEVVQHMQSKTDEDDIEIGSARMSLKCPLSYIRIKTPIRSSRCTHMQCCDLDSWLMMNESTPSWTCPSCDQEMSLDQIFVDDFFNSILSTCPDSVDEILLESNGDWHTEDGKYASPGWKMANPMGPPPSARLLAGSKGPSRTATPELKLQQDSPAQPSTSKLATEEVATPPQPSVIHEVVELSDSDDDIVMPPSRVVRRPPSTPPNRFAELDSAISVSPSTARLINLGFDADNAIAIDDSDDDEPIATTSTNAKHTQNGQHTNGFADISTNGTTSNNDVRKRPRSSPEKDGAGMDKRRRTVSSSDNSGWTNSSPLSALSGYEYGSTGYGSNGDDHYSHSSDYSSPLLPPRAQPKRSDSSNGPHDNHLANDLVRGSERASNDNFRYPGYPGATGNSTSQTGENGSGSSARPISAQGNTRTSFSSLPIYNSYTSGSRPQVPTSSSYSKP